MWALDETYPHVADVIRETQLRLGDNAEVDGAPSKQWLGALSPEFFFPPSIGKDGKYNFKISLQ